MKKTGIPPGGFSSISFGDSNPSSSKPTPVSLPKKENKSVKFDPVQKKIETTTKPHSTSSNFWEAKPSYFSGNSNPYRANVPNLFAPSSKKLTPKPKQRPITPPQTLTTQKSSIAPTLVTKPPTESKIPPRPKTSVGFYRNRGHPSQETFSLENNNIPHKKIIQTNLFSSASINEEKLHTAKKLNKQQTSDSIFSTPKNTAEMLHSKKKLIKPQFSSNDDFIVRKKKSKELIEKEKLKQYLLDVKNPQNPPSFTRRKSVSGKDIKNISQKTTFELS